MSSGWIAVLLIIGRVVAANWSNVIQKHLLGKHDTSPLGLLTWTWGWMTCITIPLSLFAIGLPAQFWFWITIACLLETPGNWLLLRSLKETELSIYGPLNSFKPIVSLACAFILFGETPNLLGILGIAIVLFGTLALTSLPKNPASDLKPTRQLLTRGVRDRLTAVLLTALASVFLKQAMNGVSAWTVLGVWALLGFAFAAIACLANHLMGSSKLDTPFNNQSQTLSQIDNPRATFWSPDTIQIAVATLAMQGFTIWLFSWMPVGYALALFQLGSILSVYLGHRLFGEPHLFRRLAAASIMCAGAALILLST